MKKDKTRIDEIKTVIEKMFLEYDVSRDVWVSKGTKVIFTNDDDEARIRINTLMELKKRINKLNSTK